MNFLDYSEMNTLGWLVNFQLDLSLEMSEVETAYSYNLHSPVQMMAPSATAVSLYIAITSLSEEEPKHCIYKIKSQSDESI